MLNNGTNNTFSFGDALFLHVERDGQPLNIAGVSIFEGEMKRAEVMKFIASKLPQIPRYRQRVQFPPLDLGLPTWEFDPHFDIRHHVREAKLKHGTEQELKALAGRIVSQCLDRRRPLWDFTVARMTGGRTGIVARIHHCLADGVAGVGVMNVIMDSSPHPPRLPKSKPQPEIAAAPPHDAAVDFISGLAKSYLSLVGGALSIHSGLLSMAEEAMSKPAASAETIQLMSELASPAERLPFNIVCRGPQKFAWTELPLPQIKAIKNQHQATVNDVVLALIAATFARYAASRGVALAGRSIRIVIPVNVRGDGSPSELGNQISFVPVAVPLDIEDPAKLLAVVRDRVEILKRAHAAEMVGLLGGLLSALPNAFWAKVGPVASQLPLSLCNTICTNVRGPETPLYLMGHKMVAWYPWVPIGGLMGINVAILTYNGTAFFGFIGDVHAAPDLEQMEHFLQESFAALQTPYEAKPEAKTPRPKRARPNAAIPVAKTRARANATIPVAKTRVSGAKTRVRPRKPATRKSSVPQPKAAPKPEVVEEKEKLELVGV